MNTIKPEKDTETQLKHGELRDTVIAVLGVSIVVGGTIVAGPNFPIFFASIVGLVNEFKKKDVPSHKVKRVLKNLEKRKIISLHLQGEDVYVEIRDHFNKYILKHSVKRLLEFKKKKKKWNGKWFMVMFDVPREDNNKRDYLRKFLKDIGFYKYQHSIYLFPYECEEEIKIIKNIIEGAKYMSYIVAERIEHEKQAKVYFGL